MAKPPAVIGRYQILDRIGQGGMGSLFLAWDPMLERQIVIKLLRDDNEELRERFAREARSVARLRHRNIVTIFDVGEQDGQPFIAMEYIQGQTLADLIRAGAPITVVRKLQLIDELCDGLAFAHKSGIVHRDVKPANVMVEHEGAVKILDFGIARIAESGMTQAGMLIGTLNYMSPEQVAGQVVDLRSDIFAVGAVLYELLACRQAFPGGLHNGILNRILHETPPSLRDFCADLDDEVVEIAEQALAKEAQARYQDLSEMRKDLQRARQRLELNPPETVALRPAESQETMAIGPTIPARRPPTPRRGTDREGLARRRATQIAAQIELAQGALAAGDFEGAISAAEQALLLDAEEPDAIDILDRARAALDDRHVHELLARGEDVLQSGGLTEALGLAEQALTLVPGSEAALKFRDSVERVRVERERERERAEAVRAAMDRAHSLFESGAFDQAEAAAADALRLAPDLASAQALRERAADARRRLEQEAFDRRAAAAVDEAARLFDHGRHEDALHALEGFEPGHAQVAGALGDLRRKKARLDQERREAQERADRIAAAIAEARRAASHDAALEILDGALKIDPGHAEVRSLLEKRRAARDEELRLARERREKVAAAIAQAKKTASHGDAIALLERALGIQPTDEDVARLLSERRAALDREREAARQAREREAAMAAALAEAQAATAHGPAIEILRRASKLDPNHKAVLDQLAAREAALERERLAARQARERADRIAAAITAAARATSHEAAVGILDRALEVDPGDAEVEKLLADRRAAHEQELRLARERRERIAAAVEQAQATAAHEKAIALLEQALSIEPADANLTRLLTERKRALDEQREAARQARDREAAIAAALAEAQATPAHEPAIAILRRAATLDPSHKGVRDQLRARDTALERERAEARRAQERAQKIGAAIAAAQRTTSHDLAVQILDDALRLDPENAEVASLLAARRRAREEEIRQAQERREKVAAAIAQAAGVASHDKAIEILQGALQLEPASPELQRLLHDRRAALEQEREAARRAREREAKIAAAVEAARTEAHEKAIGILEGALQLDPANSSVQTLLGERRTALDKQREELRKEKERKDKLTAAVKKAKSTPSHEAAVAILSEALALDPSHREARALHDARETALQRERAEARRLEEIASARQAITDLIGKRQFTEAEAALHHAETRLQAGKALKDLKRSLTKARAVARGASSAVTASTAPASIGARLGLPKWPAAVLVAASVLIVAVLAAVLLVAPRTPPETPAARVESSSPVDPGSPGAPAATDPTGTPAAQDPPDDPAPPPASSPAAADAGEPAEKPTTESAANAAVAAAVRSGRQQVARGDLRQALATVSGGLKAEPQNRELRGLLSNIVTRSRQQALSARTSAARHGDTAAGLPAFRDGSSKVEEAARVERSGRHERAAGLLWEAADLFARAEREAGEALARAAAAAKEPSRPAAPPPSLPAGRDPATPGTSLPPPNPPAAKPEPKPPASPPGPAVSPAPTDEALIHATLRTYEQAYTALDVEAVRRIFPSVNASALARSFADLNAQEVRIESEQISITGNTATVACRVEQSFTPKAGSGRSDVLKSVFRLQKVGGRWIIVERR